MKQKMLICLVIVLGTLPLSGCNWFTNWAHTDTLKPIIVMPERPKLQPVTAEDLAGISNEAMEKLRVRDAQLKDAVERHRDVIEFYNKWAEQKNKAAGFGDPTVFQLRPETEDE